MKPFKERVPKIGDRVGANGRNGVFVVCEVNLKSKTADIRLLKGANSPVETGIPWSTLTFFDQEDASQAAARVVREATEGH
jgi:hypothetical protein